MRYARVLAVLCFVPGALVGQAQETPVADKAFFEKNIGKLIKLEPTRVSGEALDKVFSATFYTLKVKVGDREGVATMVAAKANDTVFDISLPDTPAAMPALKNLVRTDFKLKADADGKLFETALDVLYPSDTRYDEKRKAVRHLGTQWTFIRGVFIGDFKGLVVTTDSDGTIVDVKYSREIKQ
jgi:hypothetical protein